MNRLIAVTTATLIAPILLALAVAAFIIVVVVLMLSPLIALVIPLGNESANDQ